MIKPHTFARMSALGAASLFLGILMNQYIAQGIRWPLLALSVTDTSRQIGWAYTSTDSAFALFLQKEAVFVDIRPDSDFAVDHIPDALSAPFFTFFHNRSLFQKLNKDSVYLLYDLERNSKNVRLMARRLVKDGFKQTFVLRGGYVEWLDKTYPVELGETP